MKAQAERDKEEMVKLRRQVQAMQSKVEMYKGTMEDQNQDRLALVKEKDILMKEHVQLKTFLPEFELMERSSNKLKYLVDMRERCGKDEFSNYLYQFAFVQMSRQEELQKRADALQTLVEQRDIKVTSLEMANEEYKKQIENKKKQIIKMKEQQQ